MESSANANRLPVADDGCGNGESHTGGTTNYVYEEDFIDNRADVAAFIPEVVCGVCNYILKNPLECKVCEKPICSGCKV